MNLIDAHSTTVQGIVEFFNGTYKGGIPGSKNIRIE